MCVDYRKLNKITRKNAYPIPRIDDTLDELGDASVFTGLDLLAGYNQIGMTRRVQERSAFITKFGHYEYKQMSFGLCNAPATFQSAMNELFRDIIGKGVLVYLDDIIIYAKSYKEHNELLRKVLGKIRQANMRIKSKKCVIGVWKLHYLGFIIDHERIQMDPEKIKVIQQFLRPASKDRNQGISRSNPVLPKIYQTLFGISCTTQHAA